LGVTLAIAGVVGAPDGEAAGAAPAGPAGLAPGRQSPGWRESTYAVAVIEPDKHTLGCSCADTGREAGRASRFWTVSRRRPLIPQRAGHGAPGLKRFELLEEMFEVEGSCR